MRTILLAASLALVPAASAVAFQFPLPPGISGAWYNNAQPGHGLTVELLDANRALVFWHVFDPVGNPVHLYIEGQAREDGLIGQAYLGRGMRFGSFDADEHQLEHWGRITLQFDGCNSAELDWSANGPAGAGFAASGSMPLVRLTGLAGLDCNDAAPPQGLHAAAFQGVANTRMEFVHADDGSAWLLGPTADHQSGALYAGSLSSTGTLELTGVTEPAIVLSAQQPSPLAGFDLSHLELVPGDSPGSYQAALPGGAIELGIGPLTTEDDRYPVYRRTLTSRDVAGTYSAMIKFLGTVHRELTLEADGTFSGRDFSPVGSTVPEACRYDGTANLIPGTAELAVQVQVSGCGARDGSFDGIGFITDLPADGFDGPGYKLRLAAVARDAEGGPTHAFQFSGINFARDDAAGED